MKLQIEPSAGVGVAVALGDPLRKWLAEQLHNLHASSSSSSSGSGSPAPSSSRPFRVGVVGSNMLAFSRTSKIRIRSMCRIQAQLSAIV